MAAQGSERKFNICDRCFASVPISQPFCPECGAPIVAEDHSSEGSDSAVYTELARANLLRMRGEYKQAEEQCLNILKRFPNNASANTLLGDISAEQGDLSQAVEWYELSLDLIPEDEAVKKKLSSVKERISLSETAATAQQLGLPTTGKRKARFIAGVVIPIVLLVAAAYFFGAKEGAKRPKAGQFVTSAVKVPASVQSNQPDIEPGPQETSNPSDTAAGGGGELPLLKRLSSATVDGSHVLAVFEDPRTKGVTVAYLATNDDYRALGARLARSAFDIEPDALNVTVRAMRGGSLLYTADVLRSRINETNTQAWLDQNQSEPSAWIDYVLVNEWFANPKQATPEQQGADAGSNPADAQKDSSSPAGTDGTSGDEGKEASTPASTTSDGGSNVQNPGATGTTG